MKTCTIEQAKTNAEIIRKAIEEAKALREQRSEAISRRRVHWDAHDVGSDAWLEQHQRFDAEIAELFSKADELLETVRAMECEMDVTEIVA